MEPTGVDATDLAIVAALQRDGRMPLAALAERLGISVYAATERYRRLTESGAMRVTAVANPLAFDNYCQVIVGLRVDGRRDEALARLKAMREVTYVVCALGDADIIAEAVVYSNAAMDRFLKHDLRTLPGCSRVQVFSCGRLVLDDHNVSVVNRLLRAHGVEPADCGALTKREANVGADAAVRALDPRLAETFNALQDDGRASYQTVGERLGVTHTAVRGRIRRLEEDGLMRIMATVSPMRLGGFRQAFLGLAVRPPHVMDVDALVDIDEVTYVMSGVGLGGADYLIEMIADDDASLWRTVDRSIRTLPGVEQAWWASTVSVEKESYELAVR
ncbi:Lrp/AsnC family transcriptional regulator [Bifidobacterium avesanii]|uniref:AsnC family transcriptional regulator n=1 Tax=Bifidobacterium avesanii TaxID=1798157 RepID=A0A7K3TH98_9BIFI|nr:AsnC family transcriptional regulator [Bifidobacterium avesanii]NEG78432.1 AsnC family transcriptional regulator [Bifidobacterium avesanii]